MATFISAIQVETTLSYTIPTGTTGVLLGFAFDSSTNGTTLTSASLDGAGAFTIVSNVPSVSGTFERCVGWAWADVTTPGTGKIFTATPSNATSQGPHYFLVFVNSITAGNWIQASSGDNQAAATAPSVSATSVTDSLVFAIDAKFNAAPGTQTGWTSLVAVGNIASQFAQVSQANSPGASSTSFTSPSPDYSAAAIVSLKGSPPASGGVNINVFF